MSEVNGVIPEHSDKQFVELVDSRHPLIDPDKVVANTYYLDEQKRIVIKV